MLPRPVDECVSKKLLREYAEPRPTGGYERRPHSIRVVPIVTNLCDGEVVPVAPDVPVIDAILGALSVAPLFKPVWLKVIENQTGKESSVPCIDALNIVNEPISALINYLRWQHQYLNAERAKKIHLYQVMPFPSERSLETDKKYERLIDVVRRVLDLRQHQSACLERDLAHRFTKIMPNNNAVHWVPVDGTKKPFVAVDINPIDTPDPLRMLLTWTSEGRPQDKRASILEAVATGCRSV